MEIRVIDDLQEINEPMREGSIDPNLNRETADHAAIKARFEIAPTWDNLPGGESSAHFRERIGRAVAQIVEECPGKRVAIACHGGVIQTYVAMVLGPRRTRTSRSTPSTPRSRRCGRGRTSARCGGSTTSPTSRACG